MTGHLLNQAFVLNEKRPKDTQENVYALCLPYFDSISNTFRHRFRRLCKKYKLDARIVFTPYKVSRYFSLKSCVPDMIKSCLVYRYVCSSDSQQMYIGKTKRHMFLRIKEHQSMNSAIKSHCEQCNCFSLENFSILRTCRTDLEASITEALLIREQMPKLNNTLTSSGQCIYLKL